MQSSWLIQSDFETFTWTLAFSQKVDLQVTVIWRNLCEKKLTCLSCTLAEAAVNMTRQNRFVSERNILSFLFKHPSPLLFIVSLCLGQHNSDSLKISAVVIVGFCL